MKVQLMLKNKRSLVGIIISIVIVISMILLIVFIEPQSTIFTGKDINQANTTITIKETINYIEQGQINPETLTLQDTYEFTVEELMALQYIADHIEENPTESSLKEESYYRIYEMAFYYQKGNYTISFLMLFDLKGQFDEIAMKYTSLNANEIRVVKGQFSTQRYFLEGIREKNRGKLWKTI